MTTISLCGWERFQHYKDRDPPWVKLYRDLLTSESWVLGTDCSRLVQVASVLLAARYGNKIPYQWNLIRKVASLDCGESEFNAAVRHLVAYNFLQLHDVTESERPTEQPASNPLAICTSEAEKRQSREEAETELRERRARARDIAESSESFARLKSAYPPGTYRQSEWLLAERDVEHHLANGHDWPELHAGVERYAAQCEAKGSTGTQFVLSPSKFFARGPAPKFLEPFPLPQARAGPVARPVHTPSPTTAELEAMERARAS